MEAALAAGMHRTSHEIFSCHIVVKKITMTETASETTAARSSTEVIFQEDFNVFRGNTPANWETLVTSSDDAEVFVRAGNSFRMISPGNMFMPLTDPICDGRVELTVKAVGFNPKCNYGFNINFRQDIVRRTAQSIRFFNSPDSGKLLISSGTYADNFFRAVECRSIDVPREALKEDFHIAVEFVGDRVLAFFNEEFVSFTQVGGCSGQISINRLNFFDSLELSKFRILGKEEKQVANRRKYCIPLPTEPVIDPFFCDVELIENGTFFEAVLTLSGGSHLTKAGEGNYHGMRTERLDHPYFKVITRNKTIVYNLFDGFMHLACKEIAPKHLYTVIYQEPEWPFKRSIRFARPQGEFNLAAGAKFLAYTPLIDLAMDDWETLFTPEGKVLFSGSSPDKHVTASLLSSQAKKIVSKIPKNSTKYTQAVEFAKVNHFFYEGEPLEFTLQLQGMMLPGKVDITFDNAFLKLLQKLEVIPEEKSERLGVRDIRVRNYRIKLADQPVGVYHISIKSLDDTVPFDRFFAFEVMPDNPASPTAAQVSGLPYMYSALTETRGLTTDAFDPFKPVARDFPHYVSGTVFLPWYARQVNLYDTLHLFGRKYFAWLGSRCLDKWHLTENLDIVREADFAHFGVELQTGTLEQLYRGRHLMDFVEFAKQSGDYFYDIPRLEKLAEDRPVDAERFRGQEELSLDSDTYRHTVVHHWPEWLEFENRRTAQVIHDKLVELREDNPKLKFACYGPAPIYTGRYKGPEFSRYISLSKLAAEDVGYLQYEDYPELCAYPESRGSFFLGTLAMTLPQIPIAPELYGDSFPSGCPDGAVFFAHPPYGIGRNNYFYRTRNRVYEYTYASAFLGDQGFQYWNRFGLQFGSARRERLENFLKAWGNTVEHAPVKPLRSAAYVFSDESWNANQGGDAHFTAKAVEGNDVPMVFEAAKVRKTAGEMMPFFYETVSNDGLCAGFQMMAKNLKNLLAADCDILVLPPLKGVPDEQQQEIRRLYAEGVTIVCSENPGSLADLFQVKDGGRFIKVSMARGTGEFLPGLVDYTTDPCFGGSFISDGADVLLDGEIPVLYRASNGRGNAYFFNVPPTTATADMLWERHSYGRQVISALMIRAAREIFERDNKVELRASCGRILAAETAKGFAIVHCNNCDEDRSVELTFSKRIPNNQLLSFDRPYQLLQDDDKVLKVRFTTRLRSSAFMVIQ